MMPSVPLRCYVIGSESLLIQCATHLLDAGHALLGVVSADPAIAEWAASRGVPVLRFDAELPERLAATPFDYLFSIANLRLLPADLLRLPLAGTINFHDGPLPRYAGLHATSWALLHGEPRHGITWHLIDDGIDTGDLLAQELFALDEGETALTLNAKCYEAAIRTFAPLLAALADGRAVRTPQTRDARSYFGARKRPAACGSIDWRQPADAIAALVRALDFGGYANPLTRPHALAPGGEPFIVTQAELLDESSGAASASGAPSGAASGAASGALPGTIVGADERGLRVATITRDLRLSRLLTADGAPLSPSDASTRLGLVAGARLGQPDDALAARLTALHESVCTRERAWIDRLSRLAPLALPSMRLDALERAPLAASQAAALDAIAVGSADASAGSHTTASQADASHAHDSAAPAARAALATASGSAGADETIASIAASFARLVDEPFDLSYADDALRSRTDGLTAWFAGAVPLRVAVDAEAGFRSQTAAIVDALASLRRDGTYARDLFSRDPHLRGVAPPLARRWPVHIEIVEDIEQEAEIEPTAAVAQTAAGTSAPAAAPSTVSTSATTSTSASAPASTAATRGALTYGALTIRVSRDGRRTRWLFDPAVIPARDVERLQQQWLTLAGAAARTPDTPVSRLALVPDDERRRLLLDWNATDRDYPRDARIHHLIAEQARRTPAATACIVRGRAISYTDLHARAARLAAHLRVLGVGPDTIVGLSVDRSIAMMIGLLGILESGGAYLPLDPDYPADRLRFMIDDARVPVIVTTRDLAAQVASSGATIVAIEAFDSESAPAERGDREHAGNQPDSLARADHTESRLAVADRDSGHAAASDGAQPATAAASEAAVAAASSPLAYVIYTSGSTGKPKGVMVTHRNVANFFAAMDDCLADAPVPASPASAPASASVSAPAAAIAPGVWLAVTSLSFDISVLELLWTLARGFTVVLYSGPTTAAAAMAVTRARAAARPLDFSLFYFASDEAQERADRYHLLMEGAKFADRHGFAAVWTPERHFHAFGGLYPNPSVISAAVAAVTTRVGIRAGSVVLPLHHPVRVAEEWAVVDNLSHGRVGISFASGWQPDDFLLAPDNYRDAKGVMMRHIDIVRRLWRGERVAFPGPKGTPVEVSTLPRPVQPELPVWITSAGNPETFRLAGEAGAFVLTHLLGQTIEELDEKLRMYRAGWKAAGHAGEGHVTLMLHTYVAGDEATVREKVRGPMKQYLASSVSLLKGYASTFPAFRHIGASNAAAIDQAFAALGPDDLDALLEFSFERYFETGGLFGTPASCAAMIGRLRTIGVDEVACLIDFGLAPADVLSGLEYLNRLREATQVASPAAAAAVGMTGDAASREAEADWSFGAEVSRHGVTHLQCTPSLASMLAHDPASQQALASLGTLLVGGEALPPDLARALASTVRGRVINMYGPTETTVWSTVHRLKEAGENGSSEALDRGVPIGRPIANTQVYILDRRLQPTPVGVPGELYIGGDGVTRGYLHRPELTDERFVANPFAADPPDAGLLAADAVATDPFLASSSSMAAALLTSSPAPSTPVASDAPRAARGAHGARLYRTGDLARYRDDGVIAFLGRIDHQVKMRGHRIELGEIDAALRASADVRDAVTVLREHTPGNARLVAYVVPQPARTLDIAALRARLKETLPEIMVPAALVSLEALPLTPNGKIDRRALPALDTARPVSATPTAPAAPGSMLEEQIAAVWREVLHLPAVGFEDNFFDLGGHSLLTVQVLTKVREITGRNTPITDMFRFPTIRALAAHLGGGTQGSVALERGQARADARRAARQRRG